MISIIISKLTLELGRRALPSPLADQTTSRMIAELGKSECEELRLRRGSPLACRVMCFVSSTYSQAFTACSLGYTPSSCILLPLLLCLNRNGTYEYLFGIN